MSNIRPGGEFNIDYNARYLPDVFKENHKTFLLKDGDVIIAMTDLAGTPKILGVPTVVETKGRNILLNQRVGKLEIIDSTRVYFPYLKYALIDPKVRSIYKRFAGGGLQINLGKDDLLSVEIPLPPLETQKQIAAVLEKADQLRKDCKQMEQELNSLAQSVFIDMFGDPVTNPKGWENGVLGEEASLLAGFAFKSKDYSKNPEHVKLCRGINVFPGKTNWNTAEYWDYQNEQSLKKYELKENDIVIAMDRPWVSGGFKIATLTDSDLPALLLQRVTRVRGKTKEQTRFFYYVLRQPAFLNHSNMTETTVPHISPKDISSYSIPLPSQDEFEKFYKLTNKMDENLKFTQLKAIEAENIFNSLMQKAFKGELKLKAVA